VVSLSRETTSRIPSLTTVGLEGRPGGRPVGTYGLGKFPLAVPAAAGAPLKEAAETADAATVADAPAGVARQRRELAALQGDRVLSRRLGQVKQALSLTPVNPAADLDLTAVASLRNYLHLIPLAKPAEREMEREPAKEQPQGYG
jgi:hypothetical protein